MGGLRCDVPWKSKITSPGRVKGKKKGRYDYIVVIEAGG